MVTEMFSIWIPLNSNIAIPVKLPIDLKWALAKRYVHVSCGRQGEGDATTLYSRQPTLNEVLFRRARACNENRAGRVC